MHGVNGNYSFSYSFSQSSSFSYSFDSVSGQEKLETSNHSELAYESSGKKESLDFGARGKGRHRFGAENQHRDLEQDHSKRGGRKRHDHDNGLGFGRGNGAERAMKMVEKALERGYAALEAKMNEGFGGSAVSGQSGSSPIATYVQISDEKPSAEQVSGNILGFIASKAAQVAADGGSDADIEKILDQGLAGFKQGFGEAKEQIEALGMLDEEVASDIGQTYDLVLEGIKELREQYLGESAAAAMVAEVPEEVVADEMVVAPAEEENLIPVGTATADAKDSVDEAIIEAVLANPVVTEGEEDDSDQAYSANDIMSDPFGDFAFARQGSESLSYASYDALDFQLTTQDGDVVTLNFSDIAAYGEQYDVAKGAGDGFYSSENLASSFYESTDFSINVEGDLDRGEMEAIKDLMNQVKKLAGEFFSGNPQKAFERALDMGFDSSEIAQYSLNMTSIEVMEVETNYGAVANMNPQTGLNDPIEAVQESVNPLKDLSGYIKGLLEAMKQTQNFGEPQFLADAMRSIESASKLEITNDGQTHNISGFTDFNEQLLENLS